MLLSEIKDISGEDIKMKDIKSSHKKLAKKLGVKPENIKDFSDGEIETIIKNIGKHDFVPDDEFNKKELALGIRVEYEHCNSKVISKLIAKDHLVEVPDYYSRLIKMEKEAKKD